MTRSSPQFERRPAAAPRLRVTGGDRLTELEQVKALPAEIRRDIAVVSQVLPFKVNNYVLEQLIDWDDVPNDPIYRLVFPHRDMLSDEHFDRVAALVDAGAGRDALRATSNDVRLQLNPHPAGQLEKNVPVWNGQRINGLQHKYKETVLFFPSQGQTCHSYCGYCFRWAQFVGISELKQANNDAELLAGYLSEHPEVTDLLLTGGDPMVMSTRVLRRYVEPLLAPELDHIRSLRIGTKALAYWPYRFTTDADADDLVRLIEELVRRGKHVAIMVHATHVRELETPAAEQAIRRLRSAGAVLRTQSPIVRHVNDDAETWRRMWIRQVRLGMIPYYMFVERDTGAQPYFGLPLAKAFEIFREAWNGVSGLARTARGPSMSATPGKVVVDGVVHLGDERLFALRFLQARNPDWVGRPFYARFDDEAQWWTELRPASGRESFFFEADPVQDWRPEHALHASPDASSAEGVLGR